jgi:spoIIIJ-associated protein
MVHEFEGRTEKEAIDLAIESLGLDREEIDVEILENKKKGFLFGGGKVKIRVHLSEEEEDRDIIEPQDEIENGLLEFLSEIIRKMSLDGEVFLVSREEGRLVYEIQSDDAAILIGRQGKTLDAFQLLMNIYAGKISQSRLRVVVDAEDYRQRREKQLIRIAHRVAEQVRRTKGSKLLDAMNPFERRLIHTALNDLSNVETVSEGEGLYKKIRVFYRDGND